MPRTQEANEFLKEKRRNLILRSSLHLFCLKGFDNVTTDDICKEAKISHGLLYHYYKNKTEILKVLLLEAKTKFNSLFKFDEIINLESYTFYKELTDFIVGALSLGGDYAFFVALLIQLKYDPKILESSNDVSLYQKFEIEIIKAQNEGLFKSGNPKEYLLCYFCLIKSISTMVITSKQKILIPQSNVILNLFLKSN